MHYLGEISALGAAVSWSAWAIFCTNASRRIGTFAMNCYRMLFGTAIIFVAWAVTKQTVSLAEVLPVNWLLLGLSGLAGFFLADICLFQSYVDMGPRLGVLLFNTYPIMGAVFAWLFLGEILSLTAWGGMIITIGGIVWVVLEKTEDKLKMHNEHFSRGAVLAVAAALFQSLSFAVAKPAMTGPNGVDPLLATLIRAMFGAAAFWIIAIARKKLKDVLKKSGDKKAMLLIGGGSLFGVALGVWLSMVAIRFAPIGIASTIMALMPITILPMTAIVYREKISLRAVIGAIIACIGVAIILNL